MPKKEGPRKRGCPIVLVTMFDYSPFNADTRRRLQSLVVNVRRTSANAARELCQLGKLLSEARDVIGSFTKAAGRGNESLWGSFCRDELQMEPRNARRLIDLYQAFGDEPPINAVPTALEMLSKPFVPEEARQEACEHALGGNRVTVPVAREILQRHRATGSTGSNRGAAPKIEQMPDDVLYKIRSAIMSAYRGCPPAKRHKLREKLKALVDKLFYEVNSGNQPRGRGASRSAPQPDADEIAARAAKIRAKWSPEQKVRRRA